ncbi:trk system potassium uptake protein TrkH [Butyrivibrio sp. ob235]|uniref:TrkH family potassium uptake protein n=1 Tax=Butyrivibrio sp. ob235 TaxID=1761780 RepID=UPI0008B31103|nr:potassium transporter TrkG [Butyrivibrio sp. ob235]SEM30751.1 trk system potassium uptake protein TrkH [Butyrivibrio sp. ob235]
MTLIKSVKERLTSFQIIIIGFAGVILLGAFMLMLPIASRIGVLTPFDKALFTSVSAVCVTGLVVVDTATYWSFFGQLVILILIQIGGLGVITVASLMVMLAGRKISLMQRQTMQNAISAPQVGGIVKLTRFIFKISFLIEMAGTVLLLPVFVPAYGIKGIWMSLFHAVSAFCNAGFDLMGNKTGEFSSLTSFSANGYLSLVISMLIVIGGIGFVTWKDVISKKNAFNEYRMQTKVVIVTTAILIIIPSIIFFFTEFLSAPMDERIYMSVFQAITPRTAGFNTADLTKMTDVGQGITMILMLIGGAPGSTAGGMKTTTVAILYANAIAVFGSKPNANIFGRRIEDCIVKSASTILFMYVTFSIGAATIISMTENLPMETCMFEAFSAIGTVGLTLGVTPSLSFFSHILLMSLMFFGRVGGLTIVFAAFSHKDKSILRYPTENIMAG